MGGARAPRQTCAGHDNRALDAVRGSSTLPKTSRSGARQGVRRSGLPLVSEETQAFPQIAYAVTVMESLAATVLFTTAITVHVVALLG